jgi:biotin synthase
MLVKVRRTPLENQENLDPFEFIRTIAGAHHDAGLPRAPLRRAGEDERADAGHGFMAGAN